MGIHMITLTNYLINVSQLLKKVIFKKFMISLRRFGIEIQTTWQK
jgi:hypothetical protein